MASPEREGHSRLSPELCSPAGPSPQFCSPAGPATQCQDAGRNLHLQAFRGNLPRRLLSLCSFVLQLLPDELQEQSDPFLCQGLWSTGMKRTGFTPKSSPVQRKIPFPTPGIASCSTPSSGWEKTGDFLNREKSLRTILLPLAPHSMKSFQAPSAAPFLPWFWESPAVPELSPRTPLGLS